MHRVAVTGMGVVCALGHDLEDFWTRVLAGESGLNDPGDIARFTIGIFEVRPGAKSIVPGQVDFFIDFRHPSKATLKELGDQVDVGPQSEHERPWSRGQAARFFP